MSETNSEGRTERGYLVGLGFFFMPEVFHDFMHLVRNGGNREDAR